MSVSIPIYVCQQCGFSPQAKRRPGKPSKFNPILFNVICARMAEGELLFDVLSEPGMPSRTTLYGQVEQRPDAKEKFVFAQNMQAHAVAEKGVRLAAEATPEWANACRVKFEAYKWFAGKKLPAVFGDKVLHTGGDGEGPVAVRLEMDYSEFEPHEMLEFRRLADKAMETAKRKRQGPPLLIEADEPEDADDGEV
jgi:terminase small subunit-like protein